MTAVYFWLAATIIFGIVEAVTVGIVSIWFALGSLFALFAAALGAGNTLQVVVFLAVSALALILTRPLIKKKILLRTTPTNSDMLIGEIGIAEEDINNLTGVGAVKIGGKVWSAKCDNAESIVAGSKVKVLRIEGVKLIVELSE